MPRQRPPRPPRAPQEPVELTRHGDIRVDEYAWMADRRDRRLAAYLRAENAYARRRTAHLDGLVDTIVAEIKARTVETDLAVPVHHGGWWYYTRTEAGREYPVHARVAASGARHSGHPQRPQLEQGRPPAGEQVLLDENAEAAGGDYFELGALELSPDDSRLLVGVDRTGDEVFDLSVRDLATGATLDDSIRGVGESVAWSRDGRHLFYTRLDGAFRPHEVWRHVVGTDPAADTRVLVEPDERFFLSVGATKDDAWIVLSAQSKTTSQAWVLHAGTPQHEPISVACRRAGVLYEVEPCGQGILLWHNESRPNFEICWLPHAGADRDCWVALGWTDEHELVGAVDAFDGFVAIALRSAGRTAVRVVPVLDPAHPVAGPAGFGMPVEVRPPDSHGPEDVGTIGLGATPDPGSRSLQIVHESFARPPSVWDLDVASGQWQLLRRRPVPGYDLGHLRERRIWATAPDGAAVPITLVHHARVTTDGTAAAVLYGYGAYGVPLDPVFSVSLLSLAERGVVFAVAHVRGGTDLGWGWYEQGRLEHKENSVTDFLACADALVEQGWCASDRVAAQGASAGGLLVGAALNRAPQRFRVVHAQVPFVDVLTTMLDPSLPLTVTEREEWGDPIADPAAYTRLRGYAPYDNVGTGPYPAVLVTASVHDTRVQVTEPAKWVARLRDRTEPDPARPILLRTELAAGHGGRSGRYRVWREVAWEWAVLLDLLGCLRTDPGHLTADRVQAGSSRGVD